MEAKERIAQCKIEIMDILLKRPDNANDHKHAHLCVLAQLHSTLSDQDRALRSCAGRGTFDRAAGQMGFSACGESSHLTPKCLKRAPNRPMTPTWTRTTAHLWQISTKSTDPCQTYCPSRNLTLPSH